MTDDGTGQVATLRERTPEHTRWLMLLLATATLLGAVIGVTAFPDAWPVIGAMTLVQLGVVALGSVAPRRPVLWAVAVAVACLGSALLDPRLSELAYSGAIPFINVGTALAALNLYRHADDWTRVATGTAALVLGSVSLVAVSIQASVPAATAIMAASVHFLVGVIAALLLHLRDARDDRVRRPELAVEAEIGDARTAVPAPGSLEAAQRALTIVALRSDELATSTGDVSARRAAADLRDVARRGLTGASSGEHSVARIELRPVSAATASASPPDGVDAGPPMPDLPDREREVLKLVATGASNAAIGRSLYLSEATVKQYVSRLMRRFDRENRTQLALMAARWFEP